MSVTAEPNKPDWPQNVFVFEPSDNADDIKMIQETIKPTEDPEIEYDLLDEDGNKIGGKGKTRTSGHHFSNKHYALLFAPGEYKDCDFEVGYYVQMAGLGKTAKGEGSVTFTRSAADKASGPFVPAINKDIPKTKGGSIADPNGGLCLDTFWRSAENFTADKCQWAVSQAAPIRSMHIKEELMIGEAAAYSSGGFVANTEVDSRTSFGANQQWFSRGVHFGGETVGGSWSTVYAGCTGNVPEAGQNRYWEGKPAFHCASVEETPAARVEKPFIALNKEKNYELIVPALTTTTGPQLDIEHADVRPFSQVKVGKPILPVDKEGKYAEHDDATYNDLTDEDRRITNELQAALDEKKDLVLCPGVFFLTKSLIVKHPDQVILGLGLATLVAPQDGSPCIRVDSNVAGVRVAGLTLEASLQKGESNPQTMNKDGVKSLIDVGIPGVEDAGDAKNPTVLSDIFTRVGGSNLNRNVSTDAMVRIHSGNVIGDNLWLWRADHVRLAEGEMYNDPNFKLYHQVRIWSEEKEGEKVNECIVKNALVVTGNDVKMYGLFCEHTVEHQMIWKGDRGHVSFFQCELPYDVNVDYGEAGFAGYYVDPDVETHTGIGIGVYSNYQCYPVETPHGIIVPAKPGVQIESPFTVFLNNKGSIGNVIKKGEESLGDKVTASSKLSRAWIGLQ